MSRSYKHEPVCGGRDKFYKKQANRKVRRNKMDLKLSKGGYRKVYDSWVIRDYFSRRTWKEFWHRCWEIHEHLMAFCPKSEYAKVPDYKESYREWWRYYKMK